MASYTSSSKNFWYTLVLTAVLVLAAAAQNATWPDEGYFEGKRSIAFWKNKVHGVKDGSINILLAGDSRVYRGLSPAAFEAVLPQTRAYNFGFSSGGHNPIIFNELGRMLINDENAVRAIVLGITPISLTPRAQKNEEFFLYKEMGPVTVADTAQDFFRPMTFKRLKKTIRKTPEDPFSYSFIYHENGWVSSDINKRDETIALESYKTIFDNNKVDALTINLLLEQVSKWSQAGIVVVGYRPPTTEAMEKIENSQSGFVEKDFIKSFKKSGGIWVDARSYGQHFDFETYDGSHLTPQSSEKMSEILAKAIAEAQSRD